MIWSTEVPWQTTPLHTRKNESKLHWNQWCTPQISLLKKLLCSFLNAPISSCLHDRCCNGTSLQHHSQWEVTECLKECKFCTHIENHVLTYEPFYIWSLTIDIPWSVELNSNIVLRAACRGLHFMLPFLSLYLVHNAELIVLQGKLHLTPPRNKAQNHPDKLDNHMNGKRSGDFRQVHIWLVHTIYCM